MTLYEINKAILNCLDEETGEIIDEAALNALTMSWDEKVENIALWIKELNAEAQAIKVERDNLYKREKVNENKAESLKNYLRVMLNGSKFKTAKVSISYRKSETVEVTDISQLDDDYLKFSEPTVDKSKVKKALKEGVDLRGVRLIENNNIQIR